MSGRSLGQSEPTQQSSRPSISMRFSKSARRRGNSQDTTTGNYGNQNNGGNMGYYGQSPTPNSPYMGRATIGHMGSGGFGKSTTPSNARGTETENMFSMSGGPSGQNGFVASKTGFLTKRAMSSMDAFANWKERFFVLAEGHLSYYKQGGGFFNTGKEDIVHLKGELELTPDTIVRKSTIDDKANCFEVVTPGKRMFAQASTARDMEDWIKSIRAHVNAMKRGPSPGGRGSLHENSPPVFSSSAPLSGGGGSMEDYSRPSMLEDHEIVRGADKSSDPKDMVIKQLLEENRQLREQLTTKDQIIYELEMNGGRIVESMNAPIAKRAAAPRQMILDLRDVKKKQIQLFDAAEIGNAHILTTLLQDNVVDVNGVGINQASALHLAARMGHAHIVQELLARGADHTARTGDSYTALHLACQKGHVKCAEELLAAGADPNTTDHFGNGAIHMAAEDGNIR